MMRRAEADVNGIICRIYVDCGMKGGNQSLPQGNIVLMNDFNL